MSEEEDKSSEPPMLLKKRNFRNDLSPNDSSTNNKSQRKSRIANIIEQMVIPNSTIVAPPKKIIKLQQHSKTDIFQRIEREIEDELSSPNELFFSHRIPNIGAPPEQSGFTISQARPLNHNIQRLYPALQTLQNHHLPSMFELEVIFAEEGEWDQFYNPFKGMLQALINKIGFTYFEMIKDNSQNCCVICLKDFRCRDVVRKLPCKHVFHKDCIDKWLKVSQICPIDKKNIQDMIFE